MAKRHMGVVVLSLAKCYHFPFIGRALPFHKMRSKQNKSKILIRIKILFWI